jgi:hypothetical protein
MSDQERPLLEVFDAFSFSFMGEMLTVYIVNRRFAETPLYLPLGQFCDAMGLNTNGQRQRIERTLSLAPGLVDLDIYAYLKQLEAEGGEPIEEGGMRRPILALHVKRLPMWLGTLDINRLKDEAVRAKILRFQLEVNDVLWAHYRSSILPEDIRAEIDASSHPAEAEYHQMMDNASDLYRQIGQIQGSVGEIYEDLGELDRRMGALEAEFLGKKFLNEQQQYQYLRMVAEIGMRLDKKQKKGGSIAKVHNQVKEYFRVPAYQLIPEARYEELVEYLRNWWGRIVPGEPLPDAFQSGNQLRML